VFICGQNAFFRGERIADLPVSVEQHHDAILRDVFGVGGMVAGKQGPADALAHQLPAKK
jgi:hypothetical protein